MNDLLQAGHEAHPESHIPSSSVYEPAGKSGNGSHLKSIHLSSDGLIIMDEPLEVANEIAGVYVEGVQYYDLQNVHFINNTGLAHLIDLLKSLLEHGVEVRFVNAGDTIKNKIRAIGLDHILNCI